ncbi:hypothetical protein FRB93_001993 [Tulasnella sp. JGI-2019a]|nr:hypothetical protein FRB93_001993 [Tulasnella sp. JGI-2019a]
MNNNHDPEPWSLAHINGRLAFATTTILRATETALHLPELLLLIFSHLKRGELLPALEVCKCWSVVGTNVLWSSHRVPFSAIMERLGTLALATTVIRDGFIELDRSLELIEPQRWQDFLHSYPHKVTRLRFDVALDDDATTLLQYLVLTHKEALFPRLKSVVVPLQPRRLTLTSASIALGPTVTNVQIYGRPCGVEAVETNWAAQIIANAVPQIQNLAFGAMVGITTVDCSIFSHLRVVYIQECTVDLYQSLSRCLLLETIRVELVTQIHIPEQRLIETVTFPALRELFVGNSLGLLLLESLLIQSIMPALRILTINPQNKISDRPNGEIQELLRKRSPLLEMFEVSCSYAWLDMVLAYCPLEKLRAFKLRLYGNDPHLDGNQVELFAKNTQGLQSLSIEIADDVISWSWIDITGLTLVSLARYCPNLMELELPMNLYLSPLLLEFPLATHNHRRLTQLRLSSPAIQFCRHEIRAVARFLASRCPSVKYLEVPNQKEKVRRLLVDEFYKCLLRLKDDSGH